MDKDAIALLRHIHDNPLCKSAGMDGFMLKDLADTGYIEATDVTTDDSNGIPEFIGMRITMLGRAAIADEEKPKKKPTREVNQEQSCINQIGVGIINTALAILIGYLLFHYFGISAP